MDIAFSLRSTSRHDARSIAWFEIAAGTAICVDDTMLRLQAQFNAAGSTLV